MISDIVATLLDHIYDITIAVAFIWLAYETWKDMR